jgi:beta-lactamase superfamily II metal-dependent hydrolase
LASKRDVCSAPGRDEFEISVFGPGVGECVLIHLGFGDWIIVDSCRDRDAGTAAPLSYLNSLGIDPAVSVRAIVLTHWHDDHVAGASEVVRECKSAQVVCSQALGKREFLQLVTAGERTKTVENGTTELGMILRYLSERAPSGARAQSVGPAWTQDNQLIWRRPPTPGDPGAEVFALAPSAASVTLALQQFGRLVPRPDNSPKKNVVRQEPNEASVVLWVRAGANSALLGADLETTPNPLTGWEAIVQSNRRPGGPSEFFKVAHHGSVTGEHPGIWSTLLQANPISVLTPYRSSRLPSDTDVARLRAKTNRLYVTAPPRLPDPPKRDAMVDRMAKSVARERRAIEGGIGQVCVRIPLNAPSLAGASVKLGGRASQIL